jgi:hypothetical protein
MYKIALKNLKPYLNKKVSVLNGSIIDYNDIFWFDHKTIDFEKNGHADLHYKNDIECLKKSINIIEGLLRDNASAYVVDK